MADETVTAGQMRPLLALTDKKQQLELGKALKEHGWNARTVEEIVKAVKEGKEIQIVDEKVVVLEKKEKPASKKGKKDAGASDIHYRQFEENLVEVLGTKVRIVTKNDKAGKIEIDYYSLDDLDRICGLLNGKNDSNSVGTAPWLKTKFTV